MGPSTALPLVALPLLLTLAAADQHILLDTTKETMLDWTRYPYGPQSPTPGWVEESFTNFEKGINWRSYVVCDVGYQNVNNWLWTPFITRHDANRIYIEIKFSLRNCDLFPGTALQCKGGIRHQPSLSALIQISSKTYYIYSCPNLAKKIDPPSDKKSDALDYK